MQASWIGGGTTLRSSLEFAEGANSAGLRRDPENPEWFVVEGPERLLWPSESNSGHAHGRDHSLIDDVDFEEWEVTVSLRQGQTVVTETTIFVDPAPGVEIVSEVIDPDRGFAASLLADTRQCPCPTIAVFGGSEGGQLVQPSAALAGEGYAVVAISYFGIDSQNPSLDNVEVGLAADAIDWALSHTVSVAPVGVWGASRGTELGIEAAARDNRIQAVVLAAPSSVRWPGFEGGAAWVDAGEELPFVEGDRSVDFQDGVYTLLPGFERTLDPLSVDDAAYLPVEKVPAPLLLLSGAEDPLWPAARMAASIVDRRCESEPQLETHSMVFDGAGHIVTRLPILGPPPTTTRSRGRLVALGGSDSANTDAGERSWDATVRFFGEHLRSGPAAGLPSGCP